MSDFFTANWLSITSILIGVLVAYVFYRLQRKDSASAASERTKHATADLLDVVESYVINKQELSRKLIDNLIEASERLHAVSLTPTCTPITLLQDVALRLQRSRHLDIPQKTDYSVKIDELIVEVKAELEPLTWERMKADSSQIIAEVLEVVPEEHRSGVEKNLEVLGMIGEIARNEGHLNRFQEDQSRLSWISLASTAMAGLAAALTASSIGTRFFFDSTDVWSPPVPKLSGVLSISLVLVLVSLLAVYALRLYTRSRQSAREYLNASSNSEHGGRRA
ncbi:TPA: hypothetical protein ACKQBF_002673 [Pseudomonas aeruginosa]